MAIESFAAEEERISKFDLSHIHSAHEWQSFFDDAVVLLGHSDPQKKEYAIERMQKAIWVENSQRYRQAGFQPAPAQQRLSSILSAIAKQDEREHWLLRFTMWGSLSSEQREFLSEWLDGAADAKIVSADVLKIAKIQADIFPSEDWTLAEPILQPCFDHPNDLLRAAAAHAFGEMYSDGAANLPPLDAVMQQVKEWEIARPGFAGPFLGQLMMPGGDLEGIGVKITDWILEIIALRKSDEPQVPFYNGIDFHAHEILSCNPAAVGKLIDFGAESVAAMAATEEDHPVEGMQEHLILLADSSDYLISRICSWQLANCYRYLHPEGERRGYVQMIERDDVDIFLNFDPRETGERPFAATIYPKGSFLTDVIAWKWIDRLIPPELRSPMEDNEFPYTAPQFDRGSAMYVYGSYIARLYGDVDNQQFQRVWVKWPLRSSKW